jgi:hypothetical protein
VRRLALLLTVPALVIVVASEAATGPRYPRHPEGSILLNPSLPHAQFIVMKNEDSDPIEETRELFVLAAVRDAMRGKFNLYSHAGHTPKPGYKMSCVASTHIKGTTIYLAAWAAPDAYYDSMKVFGKMINPTRRYGGCRT